MVLHYKLSDNGGLMKTLKFDGEQKKLLQANEIKKLSWDYPYGICEDCYI